MHIPVCLQAAPEGSGNSILLYRDALRIAGKSSPEVRLQALRLERENKLSEQASTLLPASPELEMSYERGQTEYPSGYFDSIPTRDSMTGRSYEVGIRQQVDLSGVRKSLREQALHRTALAEHLLRFEELQARAQLRDAYLSISVHKNMTEHLNEHVRRFARLKNAFGEGYFDRRLGAYTSSALDMGIASLKADQIESETAWRNARITLRKQLALLEPQTAEVEDFLKLPLAELPPEKILLEKARKGLPVIIGNDRLAMTKAAEQMAERKILPFVELFAVTGKRELGNYSSPSFQNHSPERENFWRFGVRIPLGIFGPDRVASQVAAVDTQIAELELRQFEERLDLQVRQEISTYSGQRGSYFELRRTFLRSEPLTRALESALISRRITYFEFWGEHERLHDILTRLGEARLKAAAALGRLEILIGEELE